MWKSKYLNAGYADDSGPVLHGTENYRKIQEIMAAISSCHTFPSCESEL